MGESVIEENLADEVAGLGDESNLQQAPGDGDVAGIDPDTISGAT